MTILNKSSGEVRDLLDKATNELSGHHNAAALNAALGVLDAIADVYLVEQFQASTERAEELRTALRQVMAIRRAFAEPGIKRPTI